jgi:hypothetical protein
VYSRVAVAPVASLDRIVKVNEPAAVGVPPSRPFARVRPGGSDPECSVSV